MTTTTDINSITYHSGTRLNDENNSSFLLNQSVASMDIDMNDMALGSTTTTHGRLSPLHPIENELDDYQEKKENHRLGNPVLNKSYDILPQAKDQDIPSIDQETITKGNNFLDTTVELPDQSESSTIKSSTDQNETRMINKVQTPLSSKPVLLSNQFSVEYPFQIPEPIENVPPASPDPIDKVSTNIKHLTMNINRTSDDHEISTPVLINGQSFDTNTFVMKRNERRKLPTPNAEHSLAGATPQTPPDLMNKNSPFNTPSVSLNANSTSQAFRTHSFQQQISTDPNKIIDCVEHYYRILYRVCEYTEELKQELRQVKNERDQMSEDLVNAENAYADVKKRNEKLKLIINEHKAVELKKNKFFNTETLKRFSEESVRYTEEQKQKYAVLKQHAQEKLNEANAEIERLRRSHSSDTESAQTQLRYAQLRVQSLEQELKTVKQELEQKKKENTALTEICDQLLATNKR